MRLKSFPFGPDDTGVAPEPTDAVGGEAATTMRVRSLPFGGDISFLGCCVCVLCYVSTVRYVGIFRAELCLDEYEAQDTM